MSLLTGPKYIILEKIKALIEKKISNEDTITYEDVNEILLDENNGEIPKNINNIKNLNEINNIIKALMNENINIVYNQIYLR